MSDPAKGAEQIDSANKQTSGRALIIQAYCLSVKEQPPVDFGKQPHLEIYQTEINAGLTTAIDTVSSEVLGYLGQLAPIENTLSSQATTLNGQLLTAKAEEEAKKKDYYWLIALGPFGLIGLAIALPIYFKLKAEVDNYETQIGTLNAQISHLNAMRSACQFMGGEMQDLVTKVSGLKNAIDFMADKTLSIASGLTPRRSLSSSSLWSMQLRSKSRRWVWTPRERREDRRTAPVTGSIVIAGLDPRPGRCAARSPSRSGALQSPGRNRAQRLWRSRLCGAA
jgi:hypothetical protein